MIKVDRFINLIYKNMEGKFESQGNKDELIHKLKKEKSEEPDYSRVIVNGNVMEFVVLSAKNSDYSEARGLVDELNKETNNETAWDLPSVEEVEEIIYSGKGNFLRGQKRIFYCLDHGTIKYAEPGMGGFIIHPSIHEADCETIAVRKNIELTKEFQNAQSRLIELIKIHFPYEDEVKKESSFSSKAIEIAGEETLPTLFKFFREGLISNSFSKEVTDLITDKLIKQELLRNINLLPSNLQKLLKL